jgi:hypothetical protein
MVTRRDLRFSCEYKVRLVICSFIGGSISSQKPPPPKQQVPPKNVTMYRATRCHNTEAQNLKIWFIQLQRLLAEGIDS